MDYTICEKVVELAKSGNKYTSDLLFPLTSNFNPHKVIVNEHILQQYHNHSSEFISTWISLLANNNYSKMINIEVDESQNIFIQTCNKSVDKNFVVREKEDYPERLYEGINVLDCEEAISAIQPARITINQIGDGNQASTGNQSPNS